MLRKAIKILLVMVLLLAACAPLGVPREYLPGLSKVEASPYGGWTRINYESKYKSLSVYKVEGELIAIHGDTMFLLPQKGELISILYSDIKTAKLIIYKNMSGTYLGLTLGLIAPSILGALVHGIPAFLIFAVPGLLVGSILTIMESSSENNILYYPGKNRLIQFRAYARFPQGIPPGIDRGDLARDFVED